LRTFLLARLRLRALDTLLPLLRLRALDALLAGLLLGAWNWSLARLRAFDSLLLARLGSLHPLLLACLRHWLRAGFALRLYTP
jgi:hypothetical protein